MKILLFVFLRFMIASSKTVPILTSFEDLWQENVGILMCEKLN